MCHSNPKNLLKCGLRNTRLSLPVISGSREKMSLTVPLDHQFTVGEFVLATPQSLLKQNDDVNNGWVKTIIAVG